MLNELQSWNNWKQTRAIFRHLRKRGTKDESAEEEKESAEKRERDVCFKDGRIHTDFLPLGWIVINKRWIFFCVCWFFSLASWLSRLMMAAGMVMDGRQSEGGREDRRRREREKGERETVGRERDRIQEWRLFLLPRLSLSLSRIVQAGTKQCIQPAAAVSASSSFSPWYPLLSLLASSSPSSTFLSIFPSFSLFFYLVSSFSFSWYPNYTAVPPPPSSHTSHLSRLVFSPSLSLHYPLLSSWKSRRPRERGREGGEKRDPKTSILVGNNFISDTLYATWCNRYSVWFAVQYI